MKYRIAAYITAYEDRDALNICIEAIFRQTCKVDRIFVVDNSKSALNVYSSQPYLVYERHPENIGISGGLSIAIEWAIENQYDFLWTFDQDSEPLENALEVLLDSYDQLTQTGEKIGIIAPTVVDHHTLQPLPGSTFNGYRFIFAPDHDKNFEQYKCEV